MAIMVNLPVELENQLRSEFPDLERRVIEGYVLEAYRRGELSSFQIRQILGFSDRWETIEFLSEHGAYPNYDLEDLERDRKTHELLAKEGKIAP